MRGLRTIHVLSFFTCLPFYECGADRRFTNRRSGVVMKLVRPAGTTRHLCAPGLESCPCKEEYVSGAGSGWASVVPRLPEAPPPLPGVLTYSPPQADVTEAGT